MKQARLTGKCAEFLRFAAVAVTGLVVDISVAWGLSAALGLDLVLAAAMGFATGAVFNYLLHAFWTFQQVEHHMPLRRMLRYGGALGATLATRLVVVYSLSQVLNAGQNHLVILLLATVLSFAMSYLLNKLFVFRPASPLEAASKGNRP